MTDTIAEDIHQLGSMLALQETNAGTGVFATHFFEAGDTIAWVTGRMIDDPNYASLYCVEMGPSLSLEPDAPFRFLNHSCDPNCVFVSGVEDEEIEEGRISGVYPEEMLGLDVIRTIYPGEQLTIDYQWPANFAIRCLCESDNCRGWVVDKSELHRVNEPESIGLSFAEPNEMRL